jgi:hypothetical protein
MASSKQKFAPHETGATAEAPPGPSNRSFGFVVGGIFGALGALRFFVWDHAGVFTIGMMAIGAALIFFALVAPGLLTTLNRLWMKLGLLLGIIITPIVMGLVYLTTFIPIGLLMRLRGYDPLKRAQKSEEESYWIVREPAGPDPKTMPNQF